MLEELYNIYFFISSTNVVLCNRLLSILNAEVSHVWTEAFVFETQKTFRDQLYNKRVLCSNQNNTTAAWIFKTLRSLQQCWPCSKAQGTHVVWNLYLDTKNGTELLLILLCFIRRLSTTSNAFCCPVFSV